MTTKFSLKKRLRQSFPYELQRLYACIAYPGEMARYHQLRTKNIQSDDQISLKPFLKHKTIFFHLPKCAGISISKKLFGCRAGGHMDVHAYRNAFSRCEYESFFKFTFVRNPWDRLVSAYHFLRDGGLNESDRQRARTTVAKYNCFEDFVINYLQYANLLDNKLLHFTPMHHFLCRSPNMNPEVDYIGRFETLIDDFDSISRRLSLPISLSHFNASISRPKDYRYSYTDLSAEITAKVYKRDIELFQYKF